MICHLNLHNICIELDERHVREGREGLFEFHIGKPPYADIKCGGQLLSLGKPTVRF